MAIPKWRLTLVAAVLACGALIGCVDGSPTPEPAGPNESSGGAPGAGGSSSSGGDPGSGGSGPASSSGGAGGNPSSGTSGSGGTTVTSDAGSAGGAGGGGGAPIMGPVIPPAERGATLPYLEYEAEDLDTNGTKIGPSRNLGEIPSEASARRAVRLDANGQYVRVVTKGNANSIVVRYAIPDSADGKGMNATLSVYVDGTARAKLAVTSRYSWTYGGFPNGSPNDPGQGSPHHFFDEARALIGQVPTGATISIQKDPTDTAPYYVIDLIDLEQVAPPLAKPDKFDPITDCGATPDDDTDDQKAIQMCIDRGRLSGRGVFIPAGTFRALAKPLSVDGVTIRGAGMWYSTISGYNAHFDCYGNNCKYYDFSVFGDTVVRDDTSSETAFGGVSGTGTLLENIWAEHNKTGYWVGPNANGLIIRHSRFRNLYADGVNFWKGTSNSIVEQSHFRNTGDDAMAAWSEATGGPDASNVFRFNTVQVPWMANCFGLYGGRDNHIEDNICADVVQYPGILIAQQFNSQPFQGTTSVLRNSLVRAGGFAYKDGQGALKILAEQGAMSGFLIQDLLIQDATYAGIHLQGGMRIDNLRFANVNITNPGAAGIQVNGDANGAATANGVVVNKGGLDDRSKGAFSWSREAGNTGW